MADIVIFSGSHQNYVEEVVKSFDKDCIVSQILSNQNCDIQNGKMVKDIQKLGRGLNDVVLIDSNFSSFLQHIYNCVPMLPYFGAEDDD